jgi:hypothetical protein
MSHSTITTKSSLTAKMNAVRSPHCSTKLLDTLSTDSSVDVKFYVAYNNNVSSEILIKMADNFVEEKKRNKFAHCSHLFAVATNPKTPVETLRKLSNIKVNRLAEYISRNDNCDTEILNNLVDIKNYWVNINVTERSNISEKILLKILKLRTDWATLERLLRNPTVIENKRLTELLRSIQYINSINYPRR